MTARNRGVMRISLSRYRPNYLSVRPLPWRCGKRATRHSKVPQDSSSHPGLQRQFELYTSALNGAPPAFPIHPDELEQAAKAILPKKAYDYVAGGAATEQTV